MTEIEITHMVHPTVLWGIFSPEERFERQSSEEKGERGHRKKVTQSPPVSGDKSQQVP